MGQKDEKTLREMGLKLANFRRKLAHAIGQKKITQAEFGEMFGGQSPRMVTSFETGEVGEILIISGLARSYDGGARAGWCVL